MKVFVAILCLGLACEVQPAWPAEQNAAASNSKTTVRTVDDVRRVDDKHKGAFYALYTRAGAKGTKPYVDSSYPLTFISI
jgi:hypothetical protein